MPVPAPPLRACIPHRPQRHLATRLTLPPPHAPTLHRSPAPMSLTEAPVTGLVKVFASIGTKLVNAAITSVTAPAPGTIVITTAEGALTYRIMSVRTAPPCLPALTPPPACAAPGPRPCSALAALLGCLLGLACQALTCTHAPLPDCSAPAAPPPWAWAPPTSSQH